VLADSEIMVVERKQVRGLIVNQLQARSSLVDHPKIFGTSPRVTVKRAR